MGDERVEGTGREVRHAPALVNRTRCTRLAGVTKGDGPEAFLDSERYAEVRDLLEAVQSPKGSRRVLVCVRREGGEGEEVEGSTRPTRPSLASPAFFAPSVCRSVRKKFTCLPFPPNTVFTAVLLLLSESSFCSLEISGREETAHSRGVAKLATLSSTRPLLLQPHALLRPPLLTPLGPLLPPTNVLPPTAKRTCRIRSISRVAPQLIRQPIVGRPDLTGSFDRLSLLGQDRSLLRGGSGRAGGRSWGFPRLERVLNLFVVSGLAGERTETAFMRGQDGSSGRFRP